ncbi:hypothetical protein R3P38DRAFT_2425074, partial [Favolaschia claudopus]
VEAQEGGDTPQKSVLVELQPAQQIGDLPARFAQIVLQFAQPYPGDDKFIQVESRFVLYRVSDSEHVIMDNYTDIDVLIESKRIEDPTFKLGLWYAQQRQAELGFDSSEPLDDERFITELGDAYLGGAAVLLEQSEWDGSLEGSENLIFHCQDKDEQYYTVIDNRNGTQALLSKDSLRNPKFDLMAWKRSAFVLTATDSVDADYDFMSVSESEVEKLLATESELTEDSDDCTDMPPLVSVSNSSDEDEEDVSPPPYHPGDTNESFEDRVSRIFRVLKDNGEPWDPTAPDFERIGDLLGRGAESILEFLQPYPGDDRVSRDDPRRTRNRFTVVYMTERDYTIEDSYLDEITVLPASYLMNPKFRLAAWYAQEISEKCCLSYSYPPLHQVEVEDLLLYKVQQYLADVALFLPQFQDVSIRQIDRESDEEAWFLISMPFNGLDICEVLTERQLRNYRFDLIRWIHRRQFET